MGDMDKWAEAITYIAITATESPQDKITVWEIITIISTQVEKALLSHLTVEVLQWFNLRIYEVEQTQMLTSRCLIQINL